MILIKMESGLTTFIIYQPFIPAWFLVLLSWNILEQNYNYEEGIATQFYLVKC